MRGGGILRTILYWLAVLIVSLALLVALVLFFESRDASEVERTGAPPARLA